MPAPISVEAAVATLADQATPWIRSCALIGLLVLSTCGQTALAETLSFKCEEQDAGQPAEITAIYESEQSGTLKLVASFGEIELPATMGTMMMS